MQAALNPPSAPLGGNPVILYPWLKAVYTLDSYHMYHVSCASKDPKRVARQASTR